jgi:hypothetical protein
MFIFLVILGIFLKNLFLRCILENTFLFHRIFKIILHDNIFIAEILIKLLMNH